MTTKPVKDKVGGKLREVKGAVTGNKGEEARGKAQGAKGAVEGKARTAGKTPAGKRA
ncbi:MAG TPA: CsbD family protein [Chloroflexota bacterium]|nr:CsbD family protein [Chloroflexota bacterium]